MNNVIGECPICKGDLIVSKLSCNHCGTEISGKFKLSKFNYLSIEHLYFIEVFIKNRGSIKAIEKELGISYPTVKKNLDEVIVSLGYEVDDEEKANKAEVFKKLENGEISALEAAKLLK
ncbi:DUF2089 domain-containing protein [Candidatus Xianfuyuplasma coldseepsis]|uniref:DUF2089 domain-containing protein n=1 Tax=Candidatus Xianfuyuplasma coldseepsis TaxID=2782163 RepID=A0A7L7KQ83_9MOLU|nr:DUF2089 domain-containing protein [Xianfuyuplasma coldseepsis]QMS84745.1 DUF2089 domain-containing protein [Xianfuyuplasma coldseepsis]